MLLKRGMLESQQIELNRSVAVNYNIAVRLMDSIFRSFPLKFDTLSEHPVSATKKEDPAKNNVISSEIYT